MVRYCCREHQINDFQRHHKEFCKDLKIAMAKTEKEKFKLTQDPNNGDLFVDCVGHFWGVLETRPYMRARTEVIRALEMLGSELSLSKAVLDIRDCLRLCRGDNIGLRFLAPGIMLRIAGRDQECYDFIKWYNNY